mmetsp:Transcript_9284/g.22537  ORF Transcript_9284/g.22537 Transcript_9284/m.22537 type:complete len:100 (-) Transcript_9284:98-397(-)
MAMEKNTSSWVKALWSQVYQREKPSGEAILQSFGVSITLIIWFRKLSKHKIFKTNPKRSKFVSPSTGHVFFCWRLRLINRKGVFRNKWRKWFWEERAPW